MKRLSFTYVVGVVLLIGSSTFLSLHAFTSISIPIPSRESGWFIAKSSSFLVTVQLESLVNKDEFPIPEECFAWAGPNTTAGCFQPLQEATGFCNSLYRVNLTGDRLTDSCTTTRPAVLKIFSELARERLQVSGIRPIGSFDRRMGELGLGPKVYHSSNRAILMEWMTQGNVLNESQVHGSDDPASQVLLRSVATFLAQLHQQLHSFSDDNDSDDAVDESPPNNMLWSSLKVLLQKIPDAETQQYYRRQVEWHRRMLEPLQLPTVLGHGDFKPSNVLHLDTCMMGNESGSTIRFIDLETAGQHYRAFDLAKFFRTQNPTPHTTPNQRLFLNTYLDRTADEMKRTPTTHLSSSSSIDRLLLECRLLLPMTWLEAAIFFQASRRPGTPWQALAEDRTHHYQIACEQFEEDVTAYQLVIKS